MKSRQLAFEPPYPIIAAHVRQDESTTVVSIRSSDPYKIIRFLGDQLRPLGYEVSFDHDYGEGEGHEPA